MAISKQSYLAMVVGLTMLLTACTEQNQGQKKIDTGLVKVIKAGKLVNYQSKTIGNAFDSYKYLVRKEWNEKQLKSGHLTVEFTAWLEPRFLDDKARQEGVTDRGLEITFVINPDGSYYLFMISALDKKSDGNVYSTKSMDTASVLKNIYVNEKIDF